MQREYRTPEIEVYVFACTDVLTASNETPFVPFIDENETPFVPMAASETGTDGSSAT